MEQNQDNKFIFSLHEGEKSRKVFLNKDGLCVIEEKDLSDDFKKTYDRFVFENQGKIRKWFSKMYAKPFDYPNDILSKIFQFLFVPAPVVSYPAEILDIGCSSGGFLLNISDKWIKKGIEINTKAANIAKLKGLDVESVTLEDFYTDKKFGYIRASHVIEHMNNPEIFFKKTRLLMNENSKLIIYTPNYQSFSRMIFNKYWDGFYDITHFNIFDPRSLKLIAEQNGFKIISCKTYNMGYIAPSMIRILGIDNSFLESMFFWSLYLVFYPIGFLFGRLGFGDAIFMEMKLKK